MAISDKLTALKQAALELNIATVTVFRDAETVAAKSGERVLAAEAVVDAASAKLTELATESGGEFTKEVAAAKQALQVAKDNLDLATRAKTGAEGRLAEARREQKRLAFANTRKRIEKQLKQRAEAADYISRGIETFWAGWQMLHGINGALQTSYPGGILPGGSVAAPEDVQRAVETELYRVGGAPFVGGVIGKLGFAGSIPPLPGAERQGAKTGRREDLPTLSAAIEQANAHILKHTDGE